MCTYRSKEKGSLLYDSDLENQNNDELIIIFDGAVELYLTMDAGTEFPIDILTTGSILNPHNFLAKRRQATNVRFTKNTIFYFLTYAQLVSVARNYKEFSKVLLREKGKAEAMKSRDQNPMNYIVGFEHMNDIDGAPLDQKVRQKMIKAKIALKNSVVYMILKHRKDRKVKNLRKILEEFI